MLLKDKNNINLDIKKILIVISKLVLTFVKP